MTKFYYIYTAKAPVNIALIKYWGKEHEKLKIPINDSLSGTLSIDDMCATTSVALSDSFNDDQLWLNGTKQTMQSHSLPAILINCLRQMSTLDSSIVNACKVHIVSYNNFPTAAGLASSAAGFACLAFVLGQAYGVTDPIVLSRLARQASGSACRSLFGGFVQWHKGIDHESSQAEQIVDHHFWPQMRVVICVVNDQQKDTSSSEGMQRSVLTSELIHYRANKIVPERITKLKQAILEKNFETFAQITVQDSNQFHAICLDTYPPIFYLNETSLQIIKICSIINNHYKKMKLAYTFDAGPNACIYLLDDFVDIFITVIRQLFRVDDNNDSLKLEGRTLQHESSEKTKEIDSLNNLFKSAYVTPSRNTIKYLISTSIGDGPKLIEDHIQDDNLKPVT